MSKSREPQQIVWELQLLFQIEEIRLDMTHWTRATLIEPDIDLTEDLKIRSGTTADGSRRNGAMVTLIEPEVVLRRSSAGTFEGDAGWGTMLILMEPDIVLMERRSNSTKVPVTSLDIWLIAVERDMMGSQGPRL